MLGKYGIKIYKDGKECETIRYLTDLQARGLKRAFERHAPVKVVKIELHAPIKIIKEV